MPVLEVVYPTITSFPSVANLLCVLETKKETQSWIYSNYTQLVSFYGPSGEDSIHSMSGYFWDIPSGIHGISTYVWCPYIEYFKLNRTIVDKGWNDLYDFLKDMINSGYYIQLYLDQFELPCSNEYKKDRANNPVLIYGYIEENIYIAGFNKGGKFSFETVSINEVINSYRSVIADDYYLCDIDIFSIRTAEYNFSKKEYSAFVNDYITSTDHTKKFYFASDRIYKYGISYYDNLINRVVGNKCDIRLLHVLADHKVMMKKRLNYLYNKNVISSLDRDELLEIVEDLLVISIRLRNKMIKYCVAYEKEWPSDLKLPFIEECKLLKHKDLVFMNLLLAALGGEK